MDLNSIILKKESNYELTKEEIKYVVDAYTNDYINDIDMTKWLKAVCLNGMNDEETYNMTMAMINTGEIFDTSKIDGILVDKHSTGGVGDKTTLVIVPILLSLGFKIIKMSGKGLGFTGGTIDKLEAIPGFRTNLSDKEIINAVNTVGGCIIKQGSNLVPADKKIYALRDITGTTDSIPLIASSIMSKKIAANTDTILIDIKVGKGAFMDNISDARKLANLMINIGTRADKKVIAVLSNMNNPLGNYIGNIEEVKEAVMILNGDGEPRLTNLCVELASILYRNKMNVKAKEADNIVKEAITSKRALNKLYEIVKFQGGDEALLNDFSLFKQPLYIYSVKSDKEGYINQIDAHTLGVISNKLGAGRNKKEDMIDYTAGINIIKNIGSYVNKNDVLAYFKTSRIVNADELKMMYISAINYSKWAVKEEELIYEVYE